MKIKLVFFSIILTSTIFAQSGIYDFDSFKVKIDSTFLQAFTGNDQVFYSKTFYSPQDYSTDLDSDGVNELIIIDDLKRDGRDYFTLYVYNTIDTFYLADSVYSAGFEPYESISEDIGSIVYVTGNPKFDSLNTSNMPYYLPLNIWKFEDGGLFLANASVYDLFINENDALIDEIDHYLDQKINDCTISKQMKAAIAAVYVNYLNASELTVASQFLKKYYLCNDIEEFKSSLQNKMNN